MPALMRMLRRTALLPVLVVCLLSVTALPVSADPVVHTVEAGETLYSLAQRYATSVEAIAEANGLSDSSMILRGQQLVIPENENTVAPYQPDSAEDSLATYTVQPADTLIGIAVRFGMTVRELAELNNLSQPSLLYVGQRLQLPQVKQDVAGEAIPPSAKRIEVDVSEQHMWVYEGESLVWDWPVSTGLPGYPTRYGKFQVLDKIPMAYSRPWELWMPHWLGIYWAGGTENGIHSLPIIDGRKLWEGYLGSRISYGCVVVSTEAGEKLFNWAEVGTTVEIRE